MPKACPRRRGVFGVRWNALLGGLRFSINAVFSQMVTQFRNGFLSPIRSSSHELLASSDSRNPVCEVCIIHNCDGCSLIVFSSLFIVPICLSAALMLGRFRFFQATRFCAANLLAKCFRFVTLAPIASAVLCTGMFRFSDSIAHCWLHLSLRRTPR